MADTHRQRNRVQVVLIAFAVLIVILIAVGLGTKRISDEVMAQLMQNLEDVSQQNAVTLSHEIKNKYELLQSLESEMQTLDRDEWVPFLEQMSGVIENYNIKRFGYCDPDGMAYASDTSSGDLSYREFFQTSIKGKNCISNALNDAFTDDDSLVTIMSAPMYDGSGNIDGVFALIYDSVYFNNNLQISCFDGEGYSCAIDAAGNIMVGMNSDMLQLSMNIYDYLLEKDPDNAEAVAKLKQIIANGGSTSGTFWLDELSYYHCTPVKLMDNQVKWYMITIVPAHLVQERYLPIRNSLYNVVAAIVLFLVLDLALAILLTRQQRRETQRLAYTDPVTGGANLSSFLRDVRSLSNRKGYLVSMDVSNFNNINIAAGRRKGDEMVCHIWHTLEATLTGDEKAARVRDDHFVVFWQNISDDEIIHRLDDVSESVHGFGVQIHVPGLHPRYGICRMQQEDTADDSYNRALSAGEYVRNTKGIYYAFYDQIDHAVEERNQELEEEFPHALDSHAFEVWYQPKFNAKTSEVVGSEALVRWRMSDGSMLSPGIFIPLFERNGMIARLDEYMFREVCKQQKEWLAEGRRIFPVSVNLSRASLYYSDVVEKYREILKESELDPHYVQIEVTESAIVGRGEIRSILEQFRGMGVHVLMDDFGTGYSSLETLSLHCFDTLKVDKSLVDHIGDRDGETMLSHVIHMGHELGLYITAEGVETKPQLEYLQGIMCDDIQGFYFAKPMPAENYSKILSACSESEK